MGIRDAQGVRFSFSWLVGSCFFFFFFDFGWAWTGAMGLVFFGFASPFCITRYYMSGDLLERDGPAPPSNPLHRRVEDLVSISRGLSGHEIWNELVEP